MRRPSPGVFAQGRRTLSRTAGRAVAQLRGALLAPAVAEGQHGRERGRDVTESYTLAAVFGRRNGRWHGSGLFRIDYMYPSVNRPPAPNASVQPWFPAGEALIGLS